MSRKKRARRTPGTGSVRLRPDTGRYQAALVLGYDERGNPKRLRRDFDTSEEADLWLAHQRVALDRGELVINTDETLEERVAAWLRGRRAAGLAESTMHDYETTVQRYVTPHLGSVKLKDLKPAHVDALLTTLSEKGQSAFILEKAHRYLSMVLINAVDLELIPRNVARKVRPPKPAKARHDRWSPAEAAAVLKRCQGEDHPVARYVILGLVTGLRKEELLGLRWRDVDIAGCRLEVRQVVTFVNGKATVKGVPKTGAGARTVHFDALARPALEQQLEHVRLAEASAKRWAGLGLVFASSVGTPLSDSFLRPHFKRLYEAAKAPRIRLYDLRSTHGSILADAGVNPKLISERLGHADVGFTMDVYVRTMEAEQRAVAGAFAEAIEWQAVAGAPAKRAQEAPEEAGDAAGSGVNSASGAVIPPDVN